MRQAAQRWRSHLVDLGGRNALLYYRDLTLGTLDLTHAHPSGIAALLAGRPTRLSMLFREPLALADARRRAQSIRARTIELAEERGIQAGFLAAGMATWTGGGREGSAALRAPRAPVLLRACTLRPRGVAHDDFDLDVDPEPLVNPVLLHVLAAQHGLRIGPDQAVEIADLTLTPTGFDPAPAYAELTRLGGEIAGFSVRPRLVLGTFTVATLPMANDLAAQGDALAEHDVVAALAGDAEALAPSPAAVRAAVPPRQGGNTARRVGPVRGDSQREAGPADADPDDEFLVLDCDAGQQAVIDTVLAGSHLLVQGPPGTGKSQTIANLIASLAAQGRRTLFVAQKRAAIEAVVSRLDAVGVGDLVLDLSDGGGNRRRIARQLATTLDRAPRVARPEQTPSERLRELRRRLRAHSAALHQAREPWNVSAYDAQQALARLAAKQDEAPVERATHPAAPEGHVEAGPEHAPAGSSPLSDASPPCTTVRLRGETLRRLSRADVVRLAADLREAAGLGALRLTPDDTPWFGARLTSDDQAGAALTEVRRLRAHLLPGARRLLDDLTRQTGLTAVGTLDEALQRLRLLVGVRATLDACSPAVFHAPLDDLVAGTASKSWRAEHQVRSGLFSRLRSRRAARGLLRARTTPPGGVAALHDLLVNAQAQRTAWRAASQNPGEPPTPTVPDALPEAEHLLAELAATLDDLEFRLTRLPGPGQMPVSELGELATHLASLEDDRDALRTLPRRTVLLDRLDRAGLTPLVEDLRSRERAAGPGPSRIDVTAELDLAWWGGVLDDIALTDPDYGGHEQSLLDEVAEEYRRADAEHLAQGGWRVRRAAAERLVAALDAHPDQAATVRAEALRQRRHRTLPELLGAAPDVLPALRPCWAMSPLLVPQVIPAGRRFDVVIVDEASQLPSAHAVPAISRARWVVVMGDERQLPPTPFATSVDPDDEEDDEQGGTGGPALGTGGFESVLDVLAAALPVRTLRWHYRSRDEALVSFANDRVYGGALVTFPTPRRPGGPALRFEPVDAVRRRRPAASGDLSEQNVEVGRVVDLVLEHARDRPGESLGVITMGQRQARRVEEAVRAASVVARGVASFLEQVPVGAPEPFFVKTLERVQGDERDAIILSIGPARESEGRQARGFGPFGTPGGARRLNVAVTRARSRMTVVSGCTADELDLERSSVPEMRLLRDFLAHMAQCGAPHPRRDPAGAGSGVPGVMSPRPAAHDAVLDRVARQCVASGLSVRLGYGLGPVRLEMAVADPRAPERMLLAVETDGPAYAAAASTRERDRLRVEHLARLGWRHLRIWSTDAFADPAGTAQHIEEACRAAFDGVVLGASGGHVGPAATGGGLTGRQARPKVTAGRDIDQYTNTELDQVISWLSSDGLLRTDEDLAAEARRLLGFGRRGLRIDTALEAAIQRVHRVRD